MLRILSDPDVQVGLLAVELVPGELCEPSQVEGAGEEDGRGHGDVGGGALAVRVEVSHELVDLPAESRDLDSKTNLE